MATPEFPLPPLRERCFAARRFIGMDSSPQNDYVTCPICDRDVPESHTTKHHLVPKSRKGKETARLCNDCHRQLHVLFDVKTLERKLNTIELLKSDERVQRWIGFIGKRSSISRLKMRRGGR